RALRLRARLLTVPPSDSPPIVAHIAQAVADLATSGIREMRLGWADAVHLCRFLLLQRPRGSQSRRPFPQVPCRAGGRGPRPHGVGAGAPAGSIVESPRPMEPARSRSSRVGAADGARHG